ncbi:MAG: citramalate synthase [Clostridiales bacterium GWF2_38_85]|nr:MAG: citramalate synthase [Clostridiales bacterium GWF2_38_85]HBL83646.1 citramalate synthase [Clostridiales bacterium]
MKRIEIFDSTLRDGAQGEGISFSVNDKLHIVKALDEFGVDYIEAGNPGSNPKDLDFFNQASNLTLKHSKLCAFGSTCRKNSNPEDDANVKSLLQAQTPVVVIFGKSWDMHVTEILKITLEENIEIVKQTVEYLVSNGKEVIFDAEHFFDGYMANTTYSLSVLKAAVLGGARTLVLCDTNGGTMPSDVCDITKSVCNMFPEETIGIHCHNDTGCAVANSMLAVRSGATHVQGTFIGIGERCGNTDLSIIIPNLKLKSKYECSGNVEELFETSRKIAEIANTQIDTNKPYTGLSAFAHKGGMHIDGVLKLSASFEHISPEAVGNTRKFLMSEVSGRSMIMTKIQNYAPELAKDSPNTAAILERLKELEHQGYHFEAADASFELLVKKVLGTYKPHFSIVLYKTMGEFPVPVGGMSASATIKVEVDGTEEVTAVMGNGPVNALDLALRKALTVFYPEIKEMQLTDYKVRVLEQNSTTAARVRVLIETSDENSTWTTIGVSNDIIEASLIALADSVEYKLAHS